MKAVVITMNNDVINHYDLLIDEGNDPVLDPPALQAYMDKWDGQFFIDLLDLNKSKTVLEIGCGTGRLAVKAAPIAKSFCGIDISPKTIKIAEKHLSRDNVELVCGDFLKHRFTLKFDVIYSSLTFMHIQDKKRSIKTAAELLAPGGRFVLSMDKNRNSVLDFGTRTLKIYPDTPEMIMELLKDNKFTEIKKYETEFAYIVAADK